MANITKIEHGQPGWDTPLNQMLSELGQATVDTGWIDLTLVNGFKNYDTIGKTSIRRIGNIALMRVSITSLTQLTKVATLPTDFYPKQSFPLSLRGTIGRAFSMTLGNDGNLSFESPEDGQFNANDYVGGVITWMVG
ncbi:hypothetical protein [Lactiplantibacillus plantarum]|uniref:hypothetical protein n=1 Tax=Lactiplantibacillus plantarum TaxID=1590 RepID=UPI003F532916